MNFENNGEILFLEEKEESGIINSLPPWKILMVDDEEDVHILTQLVMRGFRFEERGVQLLSAYSGAGTLKVMEENPDICIILLDVVMEDYDTGLELAKYIREEMNNHLVRIILRTGMAGRAPEREVVAKYDINDYLTKSDLTSDRLHTSITSSLRAFRDLTTIERNRQGLRKIIDATSSLFKPQSLEKLASGILTQLTAILNMDESSLYARSTGLAATKDNDQFIIIAATGQYENRIGLPLIDVVSPEIALEIQKVAEMKKSLMQEHSFIGFFQSGDGSENLIYLKSRHPLAKLEQELITIFASNVSLAFDNLYFYDHQLSLMREVKSNLEKLNEKPCDAEKINALIESLNRVIGV